MTYEIGIYRGSFDPPHNGHLEAVKYALSQGLSQVTITYQDTNKFKPFRTSDKVRYELLKTMFADMQNVIISQKLFEATLLDFISDSTVRKIHQIVGSDILYAPVRPRTLLAKLSYFIIPRVEHPIALPLLTWNNLPVKIGRVDQLKNQHHSSTKLRSCLLERKFTVVQDSLPIKVFDTIIQQNYYVPTDNEYKCRALIQKVKEVTQDEIVTKQIVPKEKYPLSFHLGCDIGISGLSGDIICFIKDTNGQICLVVKIFLQESYKSQYESELVGYKTIAGLNLKLVKVPKVYFSHQMENFAFIGMSFAKGKLLPDLMRDNLDAVRLAARANLELHIAQRVVATQITEDQIAFFEEAISTLQTSIIPTHIITQLTERWAQIHKAFIANPGKLSFTHGDPNHSNWIIDLENNCVTYIDLSLFQRSISKTNAPYGFAINEVEESLTAFWMVAKRLGGFSKEKILEVQSTYKNEYMAYAPDDITTPEAQHYFSAYWSLRVMKSLLKAIAESDSITLKLKYESQLLNKIKDFLKEK